MQDQEILRGLGARILAQVEAELAAEPEEALLVRLRAALGFGAAEAEPAEALAGRLEARVAAARARRDRRRAARVPRR